MVDGKGGATARGSWGGLQEDIDRWLRHDLVVDYYREFGDWKIYSGEFDGTSKFDGRDDIQWGIR
jgi:hypothetical protein